MYKRQAEQSTYWDSRAALLRPYPACAWCAACQADCDLRTRELGRSVAQNLFRAHLHEDEEDPEALKRVLSGFAGRVEGVLCLLYTSRCV